MAGTMLAGLPAAAAAQGLVTTDRVGSADAANDVDFERVKAVPAAAKKKPGGKGAARLEDPDPLEA